MSSSIPAPPPGGPRGNRASVSAVTRELRTVFNTYHDVQRHVAGELGLGLNDVAALERLIGDPELGPNGLASLLGITTASATALVDRLENAGHVHRRRHPLDRRRKQLVITEQARAEVFRALQPLLDLHGDIDRHYSVEEQEVIASFLRRVNREYRQHVHGDGADQAGAGPVA